MPTPSNHPAASIIGLPELGPEAAFLAYLRAGHFMIQRSRATGAYVFYPRIASPRGDQDLEWVEASGDGVVYAMTVNRSRDSSYNVALIDLAEGPRMMSCVEGVESLPIGSAVRARIATAGETPFVVFDPAVI